MTDSELAQGVLVVVPTFGDSASIGRLVNEIQSLGNRFQALVIDDGSHEPIPAQEGALSVRLPANFGLGVAMHVAFDHAQMAGYSYVVRVDGDGQHLTKDIPRLVKCLDEGSDVVIGERGLRLRSGSLREILAFSIKWYLFAASRLVAGRRLPKDVTSGFQGFGPKAISALNSSSMDIERYPEPQLLIAALKDGLKVQSVPIEEQARSSGRSTIDFGKGFQILYRFNILLLRQIVQRSRPR